MRIITGSARGTNLITLEGEGTRPTLGRAKQSIFSALQFDIEGRRVLDLFAGSGQLGLECLSRGASKATFVDKNSDAFDVIRENALKTKLYKQSVILCMDWKEYLKAAKRSGEKFDLIFLDPPYSGELMAEVLRELHASGVISDIGEVIAETDFDGLFEEYSDLEELYDLNKIYKIGTVRFYRLSGKEKA